MRQSESQADCGHVLSDCTLGDDNLIRIPHGVRTGEEAAELPIPAGDYSIGTVSNSKESATGKCCIPRSIMQARTRYGTHWV
jgi:hypothetical protein